MSKIPVSAPSIEVRGARQNNLKGFDVSLPLGKLIVVSGPSGSGKSSFAFDTLYAEGQRRYVETFSPYTRQFFDRMDKPAVDEIRGIPPAIAIQQVAEPYIRRRAIRHLEKGRVVIFAAGTGNPYFSTDTAAVLRGIQMKADVIIKATSVDGVYSADPKTTPNAKRYTTISYRDVMKKELGVMDQTAITLCKENKLPLIVLDINASRAVLKAVKGDKVGTLVS